MVFPNKSKSCTLYGYTKSACFVLGKICGGKCWSGCLSFLQTQQGDYGTDIPCCRHCCLQIPLLLPAMLASPSVIPPLSLTSGTKFN